MSNQWYTKKWVAISLHVLLWTLFFVFPYLLRPVFENDRKPGQHMNFNGFLYLNFLNNCIRLLLFYANAYLFIPKLVYKRKYGWYVAALATSLLVMMFWDRLIFTLVMTGMPYSMWNFFVFNCLPFVFIIVASTTFRLIKDRIEENQRVKERETENLKTELSFLRSQVSPHFMFNVLNNMVALARKKSDILEPSLIKLSSLLRYMLYETDEDKVPVEKEVEYLENYIDLQKQRFGRKININTNFVLQETGHMIEPMLLIPFVENAFKHGTGMIEDAGIDINLIVADGNLTFGVRNKYSNQVNETKDKTSGIGLNNVTRRLNLLYEDRHSIHIEKDNGWFAVSLQIKLH